LDQRSFLAIIISLTGILSDLIVPMAGQPKAIKRLDSPVSSTRQAHQVRNDKNVNVISEDCFVQSQTFSISSPNSRLQKTKAWLRCFEDQTSLLLFHHFFLQISESGLCQLLLNP
jgi:hypothetical protein